MLGTINMLGLAKRTQAKILQASTSEVYGDPEVHPQPEDYWGNVNPIGTAGLLRRGQARAETLFFDYHRQYGVRRQVVRIFNTYGPRMHPHDGRVVSNFIVPGAGRRAASRSSATARRPARSATSTTWSRASCAMMDGPTEFTGPVNLGNPHEFTILELAELVIELTGSRSTIERRPLPEDDPIRRRPDVSRAAGLLDWAPTVGLREGLGRTVDYFAATTGGP